MHKTAKNDCGEDNDYLDSVVDGFFDVGGLGGVGELIIPHPSTHCQPQYILNIAVLVFHLLHQPVANRTLDKASVR